MGISELSSRIAFARSDTDVGREGLVQFSGGGRGFVKISRVLPHQSRFSVFLLTLPMWRFMLEQERTIPKWFPQEMGP